MAHWLRDAASGPLITPKSFRLTKLGEHYLGLLADPVGYLTREDGEPPDPKRVERRLKVVNSNMYLDWGADLRVSPALAEKYLKQDPSLSNKVVKKIVEQLDIPSDYGKKNEDEDFAESWVAFMVNPGKLSDNATFRMKRTLALSGLYGKEVLRLAQVSLAERVAYRWRRARSR